MLHVALCDDDPEIHKQFKTFFSQYSNNTTSSLCIQYFPNGAELLRYYSLPGHYPFHLIFLDVEMEGINGIDTALEIRALPDYKVQFIYLTYYPEYMTDSFNVQPFYYQMKPIVYDSFKIILDKALLYINSAIRPRILFKTTDGDVVLQIYEVLSLVKIDKIHVQITTLNHKFISSYTLAQLQDELDNSFYQIHRSAIVNLMHIYKFTANTVIMKNNDVLPLGRSHRKEVLEAHARRLSDQIVKRVFDHVE